jgi:phenylpyruvate tautomerase PptA (4-oxalocrotonate tautomerase family)
MPLVTLTVRKPKSAAFKANVLDAVHASLVNVGVPAADKFQRVIELDEANFRFDARYPDAPDARQPRSTDFILIEVLWSVGRSVKVKRQLLSHLMQRLADHGIDAEDVMVCFKETAWENWSFAGGRQIHVA